jgi:hypothetical protein
VPNQPRHGCAVAVHGGIGYVAPAGRRSAHTGRNDERDDPEDLTRVHREAPRQSFTRPLH